MPSSTPPFPATPPVLFTPTWSAFFNVPAFSFDQPFRRDDRGLEYLVDQTERFVTWMEDFTGTKLDWDKMKETMTNANRTYDLQGKCADLRKRKPCPLPGRMLVMNGTTNAMSCFPEMANLLEKELETGEMMSELGLGPCPEGEKHRVALLQNMLWSFSGVMDWMERIMAPLLLWMLSVISMVSFTNTWTTDMTALRPLLEKCKTVR